MHVTVNDLPLGSARSFSGTVTLVEGDRTLTVRASDSAGHSATVQRLRKNTSRGGSYSVAATLSRTATEQLAAQKRPRRLSSVMEDV